MAKLTSTDRQTILYRLSRAYAEAVDLESRLWLAGKNALANEAELKTNALYAELARLRADLWGEWASNAESTVAKLTTAADLVEKSIAELKGSVKNAEKVVKAIGYLDKLIALAAKLAAA